MCRGCGPKKHGEKKKKKRELDMGTIIIAPLARW